MLASAREKWPPLGAQEKANDLDWGFHPKFSISLKPTSLYSQARPQNFDGSVEAMVACIRPVYEKVLESGGSLCIDMESYQYKDLSLAVFKRLRADYPAHSHLAVAMQAYLVDTDRDLAQLLDWSTSEGLPVSVRLVKGAYWDHEVMRARQNGWDIPVYTSKSETDAAFERNARFILEHHPTAFLACGTHNIRSIAAVMEAAKALGMPDDRYEFQVLYGMAEPIRRVLTRMTGRVRLYCPYGPILPGMAYLVRRLLENTANQSFLRLVFAETKDVAQPSCRSCGSGDRTEARFGGPFRLHATAGTPSEDKTRGLSRSSVPSSINRRPISPKRKSAASLRRQYRRSDKRWAEPVLFSSTARTGPPMMSSLPLIPLTPAR